MLFHEAVGHRLEGERVDDDKEGRRTRVRWGSGSLPAFLSIVDDPTLRAAAGTSLNGSYAFDEQGVPAQRTVLVEDGRLRPTSCRASPSARSRGRTGTGAARARSPMARMANLIVESRRAVSRDELKRLLMREARRQGKPYGLVIRDITGGNTNTMSYGYQAFKGTPRLVYRVDARTGKEELVRGVELVGTPLTSVNKVMATSRDVKVFNGYCGAESGYVPVSTVAPAVLVGEIELQRVARQSERSPILPAPWSEAEPPSSAGAGAGGGAMSLPSPCRRSTPSCSCPGAPRSTRSSAPAGCRGRLPSASTPSGAGSSTWISPSPKSASARTATSSRSRTSRSIATGT